MHGSHSIEETQLSELKDRLNQILPRITSEEFLKNKGIGNEIGFYIFDYEPEDELIVRDHIKFMVSYLEKTYPHLNFAHINIFELIVDYLKERKLLEKAIELQKSKGDKELMKAIGPILDISNLIDYFTKKAQPRYKDFVLLSGVGSAYPLLRTHNLLNNLHTVMGKTPLVLFYPGKYSGKGLRLFGKLKETNYYRAFKLVS